MIKTVRVLPFRDTVASLFFTASTVKPLREKLKTAKAITEHYPHILELLKTEQFMETQIKTKNKGRNYER